MALTADYPDTLKKLLAGNPNAQPPVGQPGVIPGPANTMAAAQPAPAMPYPTAMPDASKVAPAAPIPQRVPRAAGMPSDDPANLPPLPQAPDYSNSPVLNSIRRQQDLQQKIADVPRPDPSQLKPKWYDRVLGAAVGLAAGYGNAARGAELGGRVTNRRWGNAENQYQRQVAPLELQLENERQGFPAIEAASKIPQINFENQMKVGEEARQRGTMTGRLAKWEEQSGKFVSGTEKKDPNSPTGWSAQTFGGDWKPFTPKSEEKRKADPKTADEALSMASSATDPEEHDRLLQLAKDLHKQEIDRAVASRPPKEPSASGWSPDEQREINSRGRLFNERIQANLRSRAAYQGMDDEQSKKALKSIDDEIDSDYKKLDEIDNDVLSRRKSGAPGELPKFPKGAFKGKEGKRLTLQTAHGRVKVDIDDNGDPHPVKSTVAP